MKKIMFNDKYGLTQAVLECSKTQTRRILLPHTVLKLRSGNDYQKAVLPAFNPHTCDYRIKPEPKYRPFKDAEECWQEMLKHQPFGWVKTDEGYEQVWHVNKGDDFNATFKTCTFADGTPFGIKEE